jgi:hypothetical protein
MACWREKQEGGGRNEKFPQVEPPDSAPVDVYQKFI